MRILREQLDQEKIKKFLYKRITKDYWFARSWFSSGQYKPTVISKYSKDEYTISECRWMVMKDLGDWGSKKYHSIIGDILDDLSVISTKLLKKYDDEDNSGRWNSSMVDLSNNDIKVLPRVNGELIENVLKEELNQEKLKQIIYKRVTREYYTMRVWTTNGWRCHFFDKEDTYSEYTPSEIVFMVMKDLGDTGQHKYRGLIASITDKIQKESNKILEPYDQENHYGYWNDMVLDLSGETPKLINSEHTNQPIDLDEQVNNEYNMFFDSKEIENKVIKLLNKRFDIKPNEGSEHYVWVNNKKIRKLELKLIIKDLIEDIGYKTNNLSIFVNDYINDKIDPENLLLPYYKLNESEEVFNKKRNRIFETLDKGYTVKTRDDAHYSIWDRYNSSQILTSAVVNVVTDYVGNEDTANDFVYGWIKEWFDDTRGWKSLLVYRGDDNEFKINNYSWFSLDWQHALKFGRTKMYLFNSNCRMFDLNYHNDFQELLNICNGVLKNPYTTKGIEEIRSYKEFNSISESESNGSGLIENHLDDIKKMGDYDAIEFKEDGNTCYLVLNKNVIK